MYTKIFILIGAIIFSACSPAKMAVLPGLNTDSTQHKITQMPNFLSGGDVVFGPYKATNISRSGVYSSTSGVSVGKTNIKNKDSQQSYTYIFNGKNNWNADCEIESKSSKIGMFTGGFSSNLSCTFSPIKNSSLSSWQFNFKGETSETSSATIKLSSRTIDVKPTQKLQNTSLKLGQNTGYYFYSNENIIAGIDAISNEGPVWLSNSLSEDEKDIIGMVAVALILNQVRE